MLEKRFAFGPFLLDAGRGMLLRDGSPVPLGRRGLLILQALLEAQGEVVPKENLMNLGWPGLVVEDSNLSVQIAALRKQLGPAPEGADWIETVPRVGYRLVGSAVVERTERDMPSPATESSGPGLRPSITVLPFENLSDDPAQQYFADGVTEDIIAALTRFRWFFVTGRNASFAYHAKQVDVATAAQELGVRYLLQGSMRKSGDQIRISAQLVDAIRSHCIWAEHFDFGIVDVFSVQDQIAQQVAGSLEPQLLKSEAGRAAARRRAGTVTGWDLVAQGSWYFHQVTQATHRRARELFRQARQIDPELPEARIWLARVDAGLVAYGWSDHPSEDRHEGMQAALEAVQMDERSPYAHYALAIISVYSESFDLANRAGEKAVEVSPSFALGHLVCGMARLFSGDAEGAVTPLELGLKLNRYDPQNFIWYNVLALAYFFRRDLEEAMQRALMSLSIRPTWRSSMETVIACCAALGRVDVARHWNEQIQVLEKASGDALEPLWLSNPHWARDMQALLRRG
jgi:TolB-like protein